MNKEIIKELIEEIAKYSGGMSFKNEKWLNNKLKKALAQQKQELREELEGMKKENMWLCSPDDKKPYFCDYKNCPMEAGGTDQSYGYNQALEDINQLLK